MVRITSGSGYGPLAVLIDEWSVWVPGYFEDFWKVPGYLGADPPESLKRARIQQQTTITKIVMSDEARKMGMPVPMAAIGTNVVPAAFQLANMPTGRSEGRQRDLQERRRGRAAESRSRRSRAIWLPSASARTPSRHGQHQSRRRGGDRQLDLSRGADHHRHQVPPSDENFYVFDQFRGPDGKPLYPQRAELMGPWIAEQGGRLHPERQIRRQDDRGRDVGGRVRHARGTPTGIARKVKQSLGSQHRR